MKEQILTATGLEILGKAKTRKLLLFAIDYVYRTMREFREISNRRLEEIINIAANGKIA